MGLLSVFFAGVAAVIFFFTGHQVMGGIAVTTGVLDFWTYGLMHNRMMDAARELGVGQPEFQFGNLSPEQQRRAMDAVPNSLTAANLMVSVFNVGMLIASIVLAVLGK